jgi:hypothetical protein
MQDLGLMESGLFRPSQLGSIAKDESRSTTFAADDDDPRRRMAHRSTGSSAISARRQPISEMKLCADPLCRTACPPSVSKPSAPAIVRNGRV